MKNGDVVFEDGDKYIYWCGFNNKYVVQHVLGSCSYDDAKKFDNLEEAKKYCISDDNKPIY